MTDKFDNFINSTPDRNQLTFLKNYFNLEDISGFIDSNALHLALLSEHTNMPLIKLLYEIGIKNTQNNTGQFAEDCTENLELKIFINERKGVMQETENINWKLAT